MVIWTIKLEHMKYMKAYEAIRLWLAFTFMPVHEDMFSYVSSIRKLFIYVNTYKQNYRITSGRTQWFVAPLKFGKV